MSSDDNIIDAEIVDSVPAVQERDPWNSEPMKPSELRTEQLKGNQERRCSAHSSRTGERCRKWAVRGTQPGVCATHGANAPQVKRAARQRLEEAADRMAAHLLGLAENASSEAIQLGATNSALDRAGLKAPSEVLLSQSDPKPYEQVFEEIGTSTRAESRATRGVTKSDSEPSGYDVVAGKGTADGHRETLGSGFQAEAGGWGSADGNLSSPASAFAADSAPGGDALSHWPHAPAGQATGSTDGGHGGNQAASGVTREPPTRHVVGDDALAIAAQLARQRAIESPHRKYRRP